MAHSFSQAASLSVPAHGSMVSAGDPSSVPVSVGLASTVARDSGIVAPFSTEVMDSAAQTWFAAVTDFMAAMASTAAARSTAVAAPTSPAAHMAAVDSMAVAAVTAVAIGNRGLFA
jgi:hypothetical protein